MTIKQLRNVIEVNHQQRVKIEDVRNCRIIETVYGWEFENDYDDYSSVVEINSIMSLKVASVKFSQECLYIYAS